MSSRASIQQQRKQQPRKQSPKTQKVLPRKTPRKKGRGLATSLEKKIGPPIASIIPPRPTIQILPIQHEDEIFELAFKFLMKLLSAPGQIDRVFAKLGFKMPPPKACAENCMKEPIVSLESNLSSTSSHCGTKISKRISFAKTDSSVSSESLDPPSLTQINFDSCYKLSLRVIRLIFQNPSPFLIIHSLCLLLKYLFRTSTKLTPENSVKMLAVSTILSYKLNYDQEITGITAHYGIMMEFESKKVNQLEAAFLKALEFETHIDPMEYYLLSEVVMVTSAK